MKIVVFNGSPKGGKSNTHLMVREFLAGAQSAGSETEEILLVEKNIEHCLGCFSCWNRTPGKCVIDDDMSELLLKMAADIVVFACPLYVDNITGIMKDFMDRMIPLADPHIKLDENGECVHPLRHDSLSKIAVISNCGFAGIEHFQVLRHLYQRIARNMHSSIVGEIYRDMGELLGRDVLLLKPVLSKYRKLLRKAGKEIVSEGAISGQTTKKLEKQLIPPARYIKAANKYWDETLEKLHDR